ncbi:MAG TPA: pyridoxal-dependent decarboxylase [Dehalococcoidia bacterium]|nr:pyridoxal-dependent decarboxylase [Dehalococcoidia bacterium]
MKRYAPKRMDLPMSLWNLSRDASGVLCLHGVDLRSLLERYGSPLHVVDAAKLDANVAAFLQTPAGSERGCEVYYSYKTNPIPGVLRRMHAQGIGAEVISAYELWLALKLGVAPEDIVYNGPAKSEASLVQAIEQQIGLLNFNSRDEIAPFAALARRLGKRPRVGVRVAVPGGWAGQFGESLYDGAAKRAFEEALNHPELEVIALHAHLGSEIASAWQLEGFVRSVLAFSDELHQELGIELEVLNFGGSLACPTTVHLSQRELRLNSAFQADLLPRPPESVLSVRDYIAKVISLVEGHYYAAGRKRPRIFLEPGRAMTSNTQTLLCRTMITKSDGEMSYAILDAGINVAEPLRSEYHQLFPIGPAASDRSQTYRLAGPICTPADVLYHAWILPELRPGDGLAIMDSGAYFVPFATSFSFPQPAVLMLDQGRETLLRRGESFTDMIALDEEEMFP